MAANGQKKKKKQGFMNFFMHGDDDFSGVYIFFLCVVVVPCV